MKKVSSPSTREKEDDDPRAPSYLLGHQLNVNEYTTQELLEKVQLADSLFDQGKIVFLPPAT
jgi:hypothetical protein